MGCYHIVLFRLRQQYDVKLFDYWRTQVHTLVGVVPGLKYIDIGSPTPETADRAKGFNVSLVAVLNTASDAIVYATHPAHEKVIQACRAKLFEDILICDMEFVQRT